MRVVMAVWGAAFFIGLMITDGSLIGAFIVSCAVLALLLVRAA